MAQSAHAETLRKQRELDDAKRDSDVHRRQEVQQELAVLADERAKIEAEDHLRCKVSEKEAQIASMQRRIEDLRQAEQGLSSFRKRRKKSNWSIAGFDSILDPGGAEGGLRRRYQTARGRPGWPSAA